MAGMKLWYAFCTVILLSIVVIAADPSPLSDVALALAIGSNSPSPR